MGGTIGLLLITNHELEKTLRNNDVPKATGEKKRKENNIYGGKYINSKYIRKNKKPGSYYKREVYYFETETEKR